MSTTKSSKSTGWSNTSLAASTSTSGTAIDLSTCLGSTIQVSITTTTAPTTVGTINIMVSSDNTNFYIWNQATIPMLGSSVLPFGWELPASVMYCRVDISSGTGTGITCTAICMALAGL